MADVIRKRRSMLMCRLNQTERVERQDALVGATQSRELREQGLVAWKAERKAEEEVLRADISHFANECFRLAQILKSGEEAREVEVVDELHGSTVVSIRVDTAEIVAQRAATPEELQASLPI